MERELLIGLGDHPALDFLNSTAVPSRETVELIPHGAGYLRWLLLAGLISDQEHSALQAQFSQAELDGAALAAVRLRERLRPMIEAWAAGDPGVPDEALLSALNEILAESSHRPRLTRSDQDFRLEDERTWHTPRALLAPVAEAVAHLLVRGDRSLVRNCADPTCTLWFYDRTKGHRRRWCSMALCGNRAKVRNHRTRAMRHAQ